MSYRSFKHLLGETSLERKCRFIFGLGILLLVSVSFFLYGMKTEELVNKQTTASARMHVDDALNKYHTKLLFMKDFESVINAIWGESKSPDDQPRYEARVLSIYNTKDAEKQPRDKWERDALARFVQAAQKNDPRGRRRGRETSPCRCGISKRSRSRILTAGKKGSSSTSRKCSSTSLRASWCATRAKTRTLTATCRVRPPTARTGYFRSWET